MQAIHEVAPGPEDDPAAHDRQVKEPESLAYVPCVHFSQVPPATLLRDPGGQGAHMDGPSSA